MSNSMDPYQPLDILIQHHMWANRLLVEACERLPPAHLEGTARGTFGTIHATLVHMVESEYGYIRLMGGSAEHGPLERATLAELGQLLQASGAQIRELLHGAEPTAAYPVSSGGPPLQVPLGYFLAQIINHATEHRTNITTILAALGSEAPETSPWMYFLSLQRPA